MVYATTPPAPVFGLRREIDRLFEDAFRLGHAGRGEWSPSVDVRETDEELIFAVEIPGIAQKDVEVTTENGVLTVRGERAEELKEGEQARYHLAERTYGTFVRRFQLPQGVDSEKILADVGDGMLHVRVHKAALPLPKHVPISVAADAHKHLPLAVEDGKSRTQAPAKLSGSPAGNSTKSAK